MSRYTLNSLRKIVNNPYSEMQMIADRFDGNVPRINKEPTFSEFGIPDNVLEVIKEKEKSFDKKVSLFFWVLYVLGYVVCALVLYHNGYSITRSLVVSVFSYGWMVPVAYEILLSNIVNDILQKKKKNTDLHKAYNRYKNAHDAYRYWQKARTLDYWMNLDGHQFEDAVASVFRRNGYSAVVSKHGGDGGIDIELRKGSECIAVQCKAHKALIGPSVARDLYGTMQHMGYQKGMIVSRSGFTSGVYDFVVGKNIQLVSLNAILKMDE